jgi:hypothetical protein
MKPIKNMAWHDKIPGHLYYQNVDIGVKLDPPLVDKYLRRLAAGGCLDSMRIFLAKALIECMKRLAEEDLQSTLSVVYNMAKEVDLDFVDKEEADKIQGSEENVEADPVVAESETGTNTGVQK